MERSGGVVAGATPVCLSSHGPCVSWHTRLKGIQGLHPGDERPGPGWGFGVGGELGRVPGRQGGQSGTAFKCRGSRKANPGPSGPSPDRGAAGWPQHVPGSQWSMVHWGSDPRSPPPLPAPLPPELRRRLRRGCHLGGPQSQEWVPGGWGSSGSIRPTCVRPQTLQDSQENVLAILRHLPRKMSND